MLKVYKQSITANDIVDGYSFVQFIRKRIEEEDQQEKREILLNLLSECRSLNAKQRLAKKKRGNEYLFLANKDKEKKEKKEKKVRQVKVKQIKTKLSHKLLPRTQKITKKNLRNNPSPKKIKIKSR